MSGKAFARRALTAAMMIAGAAAIAGATDTGAVREEVRAAMAAVDAAVKAGQPAARVAELLYAPDVVIIGEGGAPAVRGKQAAIEEMANHWASMGPGGVQRCSLSLADDPGVGSADSYSALFVLKCPANPPAVAEASSVRGIYVWKRLPQGWRVALEQWGVGEL